MKAWSHFALVKASVLYPGSVNSRGISSELIHNVTLCLALITNFFSIYKSYCPIFVELSICPVLLIFVSAFPIK